MTLIEELRWRGMIHDMTPGTGELLEGGMVPGYIGFDPTSDSLHIGNLAAIMMLVHLQRAGHKPVVVIGGATGMIGDPSGKSEERNLLDERILRYNQECIKRQLSRFLDFDCGDRSAVMVNNYDWTSEYGFLRFLRDIGKHLTVNYMIAKDSVKNRMESGSGISFTEFTYQLLQGFDFLYLYEHLGVRLQMGGSDQWGNIVTGTELIRRKLGGEAYALTCPLITKSDGGKFGKSEQGNVWLDPAKTSPYSFYQFWLNTSDEDAANYIRKFTLLDQQQIDELMAEHASAPHLRTLQKALARDITTRVHSAEACDTAIEASEILFGKGTRETLSRIPESILLQIFEGVPSATLSKTDLEPGIPVTEFLTGYTGILPSKGEARRMLRENGISVNKEKVGEEYVVTPDSLLQQRYILVQKGKKSYYLVTVSQTDAHSTSV